MGNDIDDLVRRLKYAERLIQLMGREIIAHTPRRKKKSARDELDTHLEIIRGEIDMDEVMGK